MDKSLVLEEGLHTMSLLQSYNESTVHMEAPSPTLQGNASLYRWKSVFSRGSEVQEAGFWTQVSHSNHKKQDCTAAGKS